VPETSRGSSDQRERTPPDRTPSRPHPESGARNRRRRARFWFPVGRDTWRAVPLPILSHHEWTAMNTNDCRPRIRVHSYYNDEESRGCNKNLECGDLSPLLPLWRLVAKAGPRSAARQCWTPSPFGGDKSPAESVDKSAHSKMVAAPPRWVHSWFTGRKARIRDRVTIPVAPLRLPATISRQGHGTGRN
jgi:hypothetical protein